MKKRNFLLGKGERLTSPIIVPSSGGPKLSPYTFQEAKTRLLPMLEKTVSDIDALPKNATPDDMAVATITLNPEYIAKSYFPKDLLRHIGLEAVGSRSRKILPEKRSRERTPEETCTTEIFVMGKRSAFKKWAKALPQWGETSSEAAEKIIEIEEISFPTSEKKIKQFTAKEKKVLFEVVLHGSEGKSENLYLNQFKHYLQSLGISTNFEHRFYAGGLCFVEVEASRELARDIAQFSLVRVVRKMPRMRLLKPMIKPRGTAREQTIKLPKAGPMDKSINVGIFDGGIPAGHPLTQWVNIKHVPGIGPAEPELYEHGVGVTSAFLFGHIDPKYDLPQPYASVDHYRVIDYVPGQHPYELYEILERIVNVLKTKQYDFINLSLGPQLPVDDDEVHAWTAVLDEQFSDGKTLATIAVGNDGDGDPALQLNRIQVPSDCVNALAIGACDVPDAGWQRAGYSSVGPGRSPGLIKPDFVAFGGSLGRPFLTVDPVAGNKLFATGGTSFSAPAALRMAAGIRAHLGNSLTALGIRTLLIHTVEQKKNIDRKEVGWGKVAGDLEDIVVVSDTMMRVIFQGSLTASKYLRAPIPVPARQLGGKVKISATLCYATSVDPHHPGNYTRSGLDVIFRPNKNEFKDGAVHPASKPFFNKSIIPATEEELRRDAHKWENCVHTTRSFLGKSLKDPVFDIHYNARSEGHNDTKSQEIKYALVITVEAPQVKDLYDQVVRRYATTLEALMPIVDIPVRV